VLLGHPEGWPGVTAFAVFEGEIAAERALAVVTGETGCAARGDEVFCGGGGAYLASLLCAGGGSMTVSAGELFSGAMIGVTEGVAISARIGDRGPVGFAIVTDAARCNLAA